MVFAACYGVGRRRGLAGCDNHVTSDLLIVIPSRTGPVPETNTDVDRVYQRGSRPGVQF